MAKGGARIGAGRKSTHRAVASFRAGLPPPPAWLSVAGRHYYRHYGRQLESSHVITHADRDTLATYAAMLAEIATLTRLINAKGFQRSLVTDMGVKTNPIVTQWQQAMSRARQLAQDLGLTPASRSRVQVVAPTTADTEQQRRAAFFKAPTLVKGAATHGA